MCLRYKSLSTVIGKVAHPHGASRHSRILQQANVTMLAIVTLDCPDGRLKTVNRCYP
jgi:hypothetical protein